MVIAKEREQTVNKCDETFEEGHKSHWHFASEDEEHRYFDDLQRVADIRSAL